MTAIWESRFAEFTRRLFAKREQTSLNLIDDLMPVVAVNDPAARELRLLRRERTWEGSHAVAGGAAFARVFLNNFKAGQQGTLVVVDDIVVRLNAPGFVNVGIGYAADNQAQGNHMTADGRGGATITSKARVEAIANVALAAAATSWAVPVADVDTRIPAGYVLPFGTQLILADSAVGNTLYAWFRWTERTADQSELNPSGA